MKHHIEVKLPFHALSELEAVKRRVIAEAWSKFQQEIALNGTYTVNVTTSTRADPSWLPEIRVFIYHIAYEEVDNGKTYSYNPMDQSG